MNADRINNILTHVYTRWLVCFLSRTADKVCRALIEREFCGRTHAISMNADVYVSGCSIVSTRAIAKSLRMQSGGRLGKEG